MDKRSNSKLPQIGRYYHYFGTQRNSNLLSIELTNEQRANQANLLQYITYIKCTLIGGITYNMDNLRNIIYNKVEKNNLEKTANSFGGLTFNSYIPTVNKKRKYITIT